MSYSGWSVTSKWLVCLAILLVCSGCAQMKTFFKSSDNSAEVKPATRSEAESKSKRESYYVHKVRWEGETLSLIAKWYTGDRRNWKVLAKANPWLEPNSISTGHRIFIPRNLLRTKKPMPHDFVLASKRKYQAQKTEYERAEDVGGNLSESQANDLEFVIP
jgi:hypothetical protein